MQVRLPKSDISRVRAMKVERTQEEQTRVTTRLTFVSLLLAVSILCNLVLAGLVMTSREVIIVPELPSVIKLRGENGVSQEYLEAFVRDAIYLFLDRTPENQNYFDQQLLSIVEPETYQHIRQAEYEARRKQVVEHASQSFVPIEWYVDPRKLLVEVTGTLIVRHSDLTQPTQEQKSYRIRCKAHGLSLRILTFEEFKKADVPGATKQAVPPPEPTLVDPQKVSS